MELVLVLAIVAILSAMAVPRYASSMTRYQVDASARRVVADLALARATAERRSEPVTVTFDLAAERYVVSGVDDPLANAAGDYTVDLTRDPYLARLDGLQLDGGATSVTFDGFGNASVGGTVTIGSGGAARVVLLDKATGRASIP